MAGKSDNHQLNMIQETLTLLVLEQMKVKEEMAQIAELAQKAYNKASAHESLEDGMDSFESKEQKPKENLSPSFKTNEDKGQASQLVGEGKMEEYLAQLKEQLSQVQKHMLSMSFQGFSNFLETTGRAEDAMVRGLDKSKESSKGKHPQGFVGQEVNISQQSRFHGNPHPNTYPHPNTHHRPATYSSNPCQPSLYQLNASNTRASQKKKKRRFTELNRPLGEVFAKMQERNLLQARGPRPLLNPPYPKGYDPNLHCAFHQGVGHHTNGCFDLKHAIQDVIDRGDIIV